MSDIVTNGTVDVDRVEELCGDGVITLDPDDQISRSEMLELCSDPHSEYLNQFYVDDGHVHINIAFRKQGTTVEYATNGKAEWLSVYTTTEQQIIIYERVHDK